MLTRASDGRSPCELVREAPCQEVVVREPDLDQLPIPLHCLGVAVTTISAGVVDTAPAPGRLWRNQSTWIFENRCMQSRRLRWADAGRCTRRLDCDAFLGSYGSDVAVWWGNPPQLLAAAATSVR